MSLLKAGRPSKKEKATDKLQALHEETIRMNVNISRSFYRKIKREALDKDKTVKILVLEALKEYMRK